MSELIKSGSDAPVDRAILHWLWKDPALDPLRQTCIEAAGDRDCVVLMAEAALAAVDADRWLAGRRGRWLVLRPDLISQGWEPENVSDGIGCVDHEDLVALACQYPLSQSWA
ncbi:MAG: DsrH/TusB family sulfur metabolism protein [Lysobacterales bacterium]